MTQQEFDDIVQATCPHCAAGNKPRQRHDTKEFVHDFVKSNDATFAVGARQGHSICMATHLRNSDIAKALTNG